MIEVDQHNGAYLAICKHYRAILATKSVTDEPEMARLVLQNVILYLILSPYDNEQADLSHRVKADSQLDDIPSYKWVIDPAGMLFTESDLD